jgi:hypothetical protein
MDNKKNHPPAKYVAVLSDIIDKVQQNLKNHDQLLPVAFLLNDKKMQIFGSTLDNETDKNYFAELLKQSASKMNADAICFVAESWTLPEKYRNREDTERILKQYGMISEFPEKIEIIAINLETREGTWTGMGDIRPAKKGRKMTGLTWMKSEIMEGRFTHLLPVKYPTPKQVKDFSSKAREKLLKFGFNPDAKIAKRSIIQIMEEMVRNTPVENLTDEMLDGFISDLVKNKPD